MSFIKRLFYVALMPIMLVFGLVTMPLTMCGWSGYMIAWIAWDKECSLAEARNVYRQDPENYRVNPKNRLGCRHRMISSKDVIPFIKGFLSRLFYIALMPIMLIFGFVTMPLTICGWNGYMIAWIAWDKECSLAAAKRMYQQNPKAYRGTSSRRRMVESSTGASESIRYDDRWRDSYDPYRDSPTYSSFSYNVHHHDRPH